MCVCMADCVWRNLGAWELCGNCTERLISESCDAALTKNNRGHKHSELEDQGCLVWTSHTRIFPRDRTKFVSLRFSLLDGWRSGKCESIYLLCCSPWGAGLLRSLRLGLPELAAATVFRPSQYERHLWRQSGNAVRDFPAYRNVMGRSWSF